MKKLYIDIDGVLLTNRHTQQPEYAVEFIDYVTSTFDCYWLTSHCKEGEKSIKSLLQYLSPYYDEETIRKLNTIKPTSWETAKTEALDFNSDFFWLDDFVFEFEKKILESHHKLDRWIEINLSDINELKRTRDLLERKISNNKRYLFLDLDGVLNTGKHSNFIEEHGLIEFDENGSVFDPDAIENLRYIIEATHADIVLTSTWRYDGFQKMHKLWKDRRLPGDLIGITPQLLCVRMADIYSNELDIVNTWQLRPIGSRGIEINEWIKRNNNIPSEWLNTYTYAILDDEDDFLLHQANHVILTDPMKGITREVADKVISILNK